MRDLTALSDKEELEEHIELYHGNPSLPVYTKNKQVLSPEDVTSLLMGVDNESKVCKVPPTAIANNVTFLVDLQGLKSENKSNVTTWAIGETIVTKNLHSTLNGRTTSKQKYIQVKIVRERDSK